MGPSGRWIVQLAVPPPSGLLSPNIQGTAVALGSLLVTLLLFVLVRVLAISRSQALMLVEQKTGELEHLALHDSLTGLPNRAMIYERAEYAMARASSGGPGVVLLVIDLDGFKDVNDAFGHDTGDELLQEVASRLSGMLGATCTVGHTGGDEFVVLTDHGARRGPRAARPHPARSPDGAISGEERRRSPPVMTASIGVATGLRASASHLLRDADIALYEAKAAGKNRFVVFRPEMHTAVVDRFDLENELHTALRHGQFFLVYQPIFDLQNMRTKGVEALLRWRHPTRGDRPAHGVHPHPRILGDDHGGRSVGAHRGLPPGPALARRRPPREHLGQRLGPAVRSRRSGAGRATCARPLGPGSPLPRDRDHRIRPHARPHGHGRPLRDLKQAGVRIAIDDFGTGYSSMAYLRQFPVDILKIDRSFVSDMTESSEGAALVHTLVQLGKALGLATVAEGIEDELQLGRLRMEGCDDGQGFYYARPLEAQDAGAFIAEKAGAVAPKPVPATAEPPSAAGREPRPDDGGRPLPWLCRDPDDDVPARCTWPWAWSFPDAWPSPGGR